MINMEEKIEELRRLREAGELLGPDNAKALSDIDEDVTLNYTLADAIREGSQVTDQAYTWEADGKVCALSAAVLAAKARGLMD